MIRPAAVGDLLLRLFLDPPAADLPEALLPIPEPAAPEAAIEFPSSDGHPLRGLWVEATVPRRGVVVFAPAFEETARSWRRLGFLPGAGYCVLAIDFRGQGESMAEPGYRPRKWATDREVRDLGAALTEAHRRTGTTPALIGVSRGATAAAAVAAGADATVSAVILDSPVSTRLASIERVPRFAAIYLDPRSGRMLRPFYGLIVDWTIRRAERREGVRFVRIEEALPRISAPLLLIRGERDDLVSGHWSALVSAARGADDWVVPKARHNCAILVAPDEYRRRTLALLDRARAA